MINAALIGIGYWGPNLLRIFTSLPQIKLRIVCERNNSAIEKYRLAYPGVTFLTNFKSVINDKKIDAVIIST